MFWTVAFCVYGIAAGICLGEYLTNNEKHNN
jgi:hypothetical protein